MFVDHPQLHTLIMQEGIAVESEGQTHVLKGTLSLISGDNLASHYLGGFKAPSGALRKCRQCMATNNDMQTKVHVL